MKKRKTSLVLGVHLTELDENVDFLFDEQIIQDERLLNLEEETSVINEEVEGMSGFYLYAISD